MAPRDRLKDSLAANQPQTEPRSPLPTVDDLVGLVPGLGEMSAVDLIAAAQGELLDHPELAVCDPQTIRGAVGLSAQLGLLPGRKGGCWYAARGAHATWHLSYRGLRQLLLDDGGLFEVEVHEVHANDRLDITYAWGDKDSTDGVITGIVHDPEVNGSGPVVGAYGVFTLPDGAARYVHLTDDELLDREVNAEEAAKARTDVDAGIAELTVNLTSLARAALLRKAEPFLPAGPRVRRAVAADGHVAVWGEAAELQIHPAPDVDFLDEDT